MFSLKMISIFHYIHHFLANLAIYVKLKEGINRKQRKFGSNRDKVRCKSG